MNSYSVPVLSGETYREYLDRIVAATTFAGEKIIEEVGGIVSVNGTMIGYETVVLPAEEV